MRGLSVAVPRCCKLWMQISVLLNQQQNDQTVQSSVKLQRKPKKKSNKNLLKRYYIEIWSWTLCACQSLRSHRSQWEGISTNIICLYSSAILTELSSLLCRMKPETPISVHEIISTCPSKPTENHTSLGNRRLKSNTKRGKKWQPPTINYLDISDHMAFHREKMRYVHTVTHTAMLLYWDESALLNVLEINTRKYKGHLQTHLIELVATVGCEGQNRKRKTAVDGFLSS